MTQFKTTYATLAAAAVAVALASTNPRPGKSKRAPLAAFRRVRNALIPADQDFSMTADHIVEMPREPSVVPIGVLDENGHMICRVTVPIKQQMGFNTGGNAWTGDFDEEVVLLQTSNMIRMSDCGIGIESVGLDELEEGYDDDGDEG